MGNCPFFAIAIPYGIATVSLNKLNKPKLFQLQGGFAQDPPPGALSLCPWTLLHAHAMPPPLWKNPK